MSERLTEIDKNGQLGIVLAVKYCVTLIDAVTGLFPGVLRNLGTNILLRQFCCIPHYADREVLDELYLYSERRETVNGGNKIS